MADIDLYFHDFYATQIAIHVFLKCKKQEEPKMDSKL